MRSVDDRIVAAVVHGLLAAVNEVSGVEAGDRIADRGIKLTKDYLAGKEVDTLRLDDVVEDTIEMINGTFDSSEGGLK